MCNLVMAGMLALIYTNDLFTAYVFIEILALSSCALMMARQVGHTMVASMRYMILSLLGSGLILIAISMVYNLTGHLLMENIHAVITRLRRKWRVRADDHGHHRAFHRGHRH